DDLPVVTINDPVPGRASGGQEITGAGYRRLPSPRRSAARERMAPARLLTVSMTAPAARSTTLVVASRTRVRRASAWSSVQIPRGGCGAVEDATGSAAVTSEPGPASSATGSSSTGASATGSPSTGASATGSSATGPSATGSSATGSSATGSSSTGAAA